MAYATVECIMYDAWVSPAAVRFNLPVPIAMTLNTKAASAQCLRVRLQLTVYLSLLILPDM